MNQRKLQRESVLLRAIQDVVSRGLADPRIRGLVTITGITLSDDGKNASVMVSVLPEDRQDLTMHGLRAAARRIRRDASEKVRFRDMPHLEFITDASIKEQGDLLAAINKASAQSDKANNDDAPSDSSQDDLTSSDGPAAERQNP